MDSRTTSLQPRAWWTPVAAEALSFAGTAAHAQGILRVKAATGTYLGRGSVVDGWHPAGLGHRCPVDLDVAEQIPHARQQPDLGPDGLSRSDRRSQHHRFPVDACHSNLAGTASIGFNLPAAAGVDLTFNNNLVIASGQLWRVNAGCTLTRQRYRQRKRFRWLARIVYSRG